jgi:hypothetical protein
MNRQNIISAIAILLSIATSSYSQNNYTTFDKLKVATSVKNPEYTLEKISSIGEAVEQLKKEVNENENIKKHLIDEIISYSQKKYRIDVNQQNLPSESELIDDLGYISMLVDILRESDNPAFLKVTRDILTNDSFNIFAKEMIFSSAIRTQRVYLYMNARKSLKEYDKEILAIAKEITDPNEDRFLYSDRSNFLSYIRTLTGLDMPNNTISHIDMNLPPLDREYGIKLAKNIIKNDKYQLTDRLSYMEIVANFDQSMKKTYVDTQKQYVEDAKVDISFRVSCAKKLLSLKEIDNETVKKLEDELNKLRQGNTIVTSEEIRIINGNVTYIKNGQVIDQ